MVKGCATFGLFSIGFLYSLWLYGQRKTTLELVSTFFLIHVCTTDNQNNDTLWSTAQYTLHMFPLQKYFLCKKYSEES